MNPAVATLASSAAAAAVPTSGIHRGRRPDRSDVWSAIGAACDSCGQPANSPESVAGAAWVEVRVSVVVAPWGVADDQDGATW